MADDTLGSKDNTWKPRGSAYDVPAVQKGGPSVFERMRRRLMITFVAQGILLLLLVGAAVMTSGTPRTPRLYLWTTVIPLGFSLVFFLAYKRGVKVRREKQWTREWEMAETKLASRSLGVVIALWAIGLLAFTFLL
ncbi:MAG: hypothetical protein WDA16_03795 [Candidatus Thermoplasmatota archaeon]